MNHQEKTSTDWRGWLKVGVRFLPVAATVLLPEIGFALEMDDEDIEAIKENLIDNGLEIVAYLGIPAAVLTGAVLTFGVNDKVKQVITSNLSYAGYTLGGASVVGVIIGAMGATI